MKNNWWKFTLLVLVALVMVAGISPPIVKYPNSIWEFPLIPGLEDRAKIIFFHVPTAWLTVLAYLMAMFYGIRYLQKKDLYDDMKSVSAAALGLVFCILATVTGSVWAKFNWGSFWHWDPRETSIFILLLIYGAYFALRSALDNEEKRARLSAIYAIIAFLTTPFFIFIMPRIMIGLHPGSLEIDAASGQVVASDNPVIEFRMAPNMRIIFFTSLFAFTILFFWMWNLAHRILRLEYNSQKEIS
jgi:heme exporter protein C